MWAGLITEIRRPWRGAEPWSHGDVMFEQRQAEGTKSGFIQSPTPADVWAFHWTVWWSLPFLLLDNKKTVLACYHRSCDYVFGSNPKPMSQTQQTSGHFRSRSALCWSKEESTCWTPQKTGQGDTSIRAQDQFKEEATTRTNPWTSPWWLPTAQTDGEDH